MKSRPIHHPLLAALLLTCAAGASQGEPPKALVDGPGPAWRELGAADFTNVNCHTNTWSWQGGLAQCTGQPVGVMRSVFAVTNFELVAEWRHMKPGGNSGIFVWASEEGMRDLPPGKLPKCGIEVQVLDNGFTEQYEKKSGKKGDWFTTHGDVFPVGQAKMTPFPPTSPNGSRSFPKKHLSKSSPEWNHYHVRAVGGEVRLSVNGEEVSGGSNAVPSWGYLALESEGSPVEFRNIRFRALP